jgi:hypothetical protein
LKPLDANPGSRGASKEADGGQEDREADPSGDRKVGPRKIRSPRDIVRKDDPKEKRLPVDPDARGVSRAVKAQSVGPKPPVGNDASSGRDGGTYDEESGWLKDKNGTTRLTYTKDRAGNILSRTYSRYDSQGRFIGKETEKESQPGPGSPDGRTDSGKSGSTRGAGFDGSYAGQFSGGSGGSITMTIKGSSVSGRLSGSYQGGAVSGSFSGSVDGAGNIRTSLQGSVKGTARSYGFSGSINGRVGGSGASGSWSARNQYGTPTGSWQASRR